MITHKIDKISFLHIVNVRYMVVIPSHTVFYPSLHYSLQRNISNIEDKIEIKVNFYKYIVKILS